jgi:hypothetical protein
MAIIEQTDERRERLRLEQLTDDQASAFLEALERVGTIRGACRALEVDHRSAYERRYHDGGFRNAWDAIRRAPDFPYRRIYNAADELFAAIDAFASVVPGADLGDELINSAFGSSEDSPCRPGVDPARLRAARDRLRTAGTIWAKAVVHAEHDRENLELAPVAS